MLIKNAQVFIDGHFTEGGISFNEKILAAGADVSEATSPGEEVIDAGGCYLIPGLIDVHTHAAIGCDTSDGDEEGVVKMGRYYAKDGVTGWCPTTLTLKEDTLIKAVKSVRAYKRPADGAKVIGIHLEGPFINREKCGAQNPDNIALPDVNMFRRINEASGGIVKLITMAPETEGAIGFIKEVSKVCAVSVGHTTADYETAMRAYDAGATHATHLFNAMPPLGHRAPGVIGAAFDAGANVELITDGYHIHPAVIRMVHALFGEKMVMISDSLRCAGMPDGDYELGGQEISVKDSKAVIKGTDTIAGSSIHLMEGLRRTVSYGVPLEAAVTAATIAPARAIRMDKETGSLTPGKAADLVLLDPELHVKQVWIDGQALNP